MAESMGQMSRRWPHILRLSIFAAFLLSLAAGFLSISLFHLLVFGRKGQVWWTVWPAGGLALAAAFTAGGPEARALFRALHEYWPWALLTGALALIVSGLRVRS